MATTLTAAIFSDFGLVGVHCGDTRASVARGGGIKRLTQDHSEGERLFAAGKLSKDELKTYPRKNILDSALGGQDDPRLDTFCFNIMPGDKVFFTTDGVHNKLALRELRAVAERFSNVNDFVEQLADDVIARKPDDNFSVLAVFVS